MFKWFKKKINKNEVIEEEIVNSSNEIENQDDLIEDLVEEFEHEVVEELEHEVIEEINMIGEDLQSQCSKDEIIEEEEKETILEVVTEEVIEEKEEFIEPPKKMSFFEKLKSGLTKTRDDISNKIDNIIKSYKKIDEELFEDLEEVLITADVGMNTTMELIDRLRDRVKDEKVNDPEEVKDLLKDEIRNLMIESANNNELNIEPSPAVMLVVGVNGVGKTTTIGKLANNFKQKGKKVLIAAGDTFRAAAIEQLEEWSNRAGVEFIAHNEGADPAAVVFDGIQAAKARKTDILICDTAGRLHNKSNLMNELNKIFRIVEREYGDATKEVLLVLDATTGQNAINQAKVFKEVANITGIALTKLDGTAKGGVIIALQSELNIPVKLVGVGEGIEDLQPFIAEDFVEALFN